MHGHMAGVGVHHGLAWGRDVRIRVRPCGGAHGGRTFVAEGEAAGGGGLGRIGRELKGVGDGIVADVDFDALAGEDGVEVVEVEGRVVALEEGLALEKLALDAFGVAARREGLAMAVLLLAGRACGRAGGAAGVLGVALGAGRGGRARGSGRRRGGEGGGG